MTLKTSCRKIFFFKIRPLNYNILKTKDVITLFYLETL